MNLPEEDTDFARDLFQGLKAMHALKMVHRDIKDKNVAWSHHFQRWVFIDFGFATVLKEKIGEKSTSRFIGTYRCTTPELQRLYFLKNPGEVDFYYNDLYGLRRVIRSLKADEQEMKEENERLMEEVEVAEGLFLTMKQIEETNGPPQTSHFTSLKMSLFIEVYRMKFSLFAGQLEDIRALLSSAESMMDPLFLMLIREKDKAEGEYKAALREICTEFRPAY